MRAPPAVSRAPDAALVVETPERVALTLAVAGLGHRAPAYFVDWFILFVFWATFVYLTSLARPALYQDFLGLTALLRAVIITVAWAANWAYDVLFEVFWNGQTPGKRLLGIRVVRDDGAPVGFFEAAARNITRLVDFLPAVYGLGVLTMLISPTSRRLGDYVAGTAVIRERQVDLRRYEVAARSGKLALAPHEFELVTSFLARAATLPAGARERLARKLAEPIAARLPEADRGPALATAASCEALLEDAVGARRGNG